MNKNSKNAGYVLPKWWGWIKYLTYKFNLKYLVLPVIYLIIALVMIPNEISIINENNYVSLDTFNTIALTNDDKVDIILEKYNLTYNEFKVIVGVVLAEADDTYEDAYAVINTLYNRTHSKNWVGFADNKFGKGKGNSMYYQAIMPNQFTVYASGSYKKHMNNTDSLGYQAIIDFLYTENMMHDYLSFRADYIKVDGSESYSPKGNNYFGKIKEENRI